MVSIILSATEGGRFLRACVDALLSQSFPLDKTEIHFICVDSNSGDKDFLLSIFEHVSGSLVWTRDKSEIPSARNKAILRSKGKRVVFLDDVVEPTPKCIESHVGEAEAKSALLGAIEMSEDEKNCKVFAKALLDCNLLHPARNLYEKTPYGFEYFYTVNLSIDRDTLLECREGLFSSEFASRWGADVDLGYRLWKKGVRIYYSPRAEVCLEKSPDVDEFVEAAKCKEDDFSALFVKHRELMPYFLSVTDIELNTASFVARVVRDAEKSLAMTLDTLRSIQALSMAEIEGVEPDRFVESLGETLLQVAEHWRRKGIVKYYSHR